MTTSTTDHLRQDLLIIPGFSMDASLMTTLVRELDLPPTYRIVVMELPLHDTNAANFDGSFPDYEEILAYTRAFVSALGLGRGGDERPGFLTACGYSLGGGILVKYLQGYPNELRGAVLCSPALPRTIRKSFVDTIRRSPHETHGWRTGTECRSFFRDVLGVRGYVPDLVFDAFAERRERTYGRYYRGEGSFMEEYFATIAGDVTDPAAAEETGAAPTPTGSEDRTPILLVTADRDACVCSASCRETIGGERVEFHELVDTGHLGGSTIGRSIFDGLAPIAKVFLGRI